MEVVMPAGQELDGMQNVSTVDAPGRMVILYHWSLAQEQETALKKSIRKLDSTDDSRLVTGQGKKRHEDGLSSPLIIVDCPPAKVPSYNVEVVQGIAPWEHSVVIQDASSGKHVDCSMQCPGCQTEGKYPSEHWIGGSGRAQYDVGVPIVQSVV
jgi:hypothetical protein